MSTRQMGLRTIWITLRAVNYTTQVFADAIKSVELMQKTQEKLAIASLKAGQHAISAGLMWMTLGQMIDDSVSKNVAQIGILQQIVGVLKPYVGLIFTAAGALQFLVGVTTLYTAVTTGSIAKILTKERTFRKLTYTYKQLTLAIGGVMAGFLIFITLGEIIGKPAAIIVAAIVAITAALIALKAVATFGGTLGKDIKMVATSLAIGAGLAAGTMAIQSAHGYQMGTRMVQATGPAIIHRGEVVYNPATNRPTQIGNDLNGREPTTIIYQMPMNIENINTKADVDDVDSVMRNGWRRISRNNRR